MTESKIKVWVGIAESIADQAHALWVELVTFAPDYDHYQKKPKCIREHAMSFRKYMLDLLESAKQEAEQANKPEAERMDF